MSYQKLDLLREARPAILAATSMMMLSMVVAVPAEARGGGHGFRHGSGEHAAMHDSGSFAGGRRHGDDAYVKAASAEEEKFLKRQIKSICRGC